MASRTVAVINYIDTRDVTENILSKLPDGCKPVVFVQESEKDKYSRFDTIVFPNEVSNKAAAKNFVADTAKSQNWTSWLYVFEDDMLITSSKEELSEFMSKLENMLEKLGFDTWMNTATDLFNHIFTKYVYRIRAVIDDPDYSKLVDQIIFCSHANPNVMLFNLDKVTLAKMKFDEDFHMPMYYIIAYLATRRNDKDDPGIMFMNFYPTVSDEDKMWKRDKSIPSGKYATSLDRQAKEDALFKAKQIDHHSDVDVMKVLDLVQARLDEYKKTHS